MTDPNTSAVHCRRELRDLVVVRCLFPTFKLGGRDDVLRKVVSSDIVQIAA